MVRGKRPATGESLAITVHGPAGVLDLVVPAGATVTDIAHEYAQQSELATVPLLYTRLGQPLPPDGVLVDAGFESGDVIVATTGIHRPTGARVEAPHAVAAAAGPGAVSALWFAVAAGVAALAGWLAAQSDSSDLKSAAVGLLLLAAGIGVLPVGRYAAQRALAAPAFAAAAAFTVVWDANPERIPVVVGITALAGAVGAAVARSLNRQAEEGLRTWIVTGVVLFGVSGVAAVLGLSAQVVWAVLLIAALFAARFVPGMAIDVPDQFLIDLERLAVTAWSARDRPAGRRGRTVVPPAAVAEVVARGARIVTAAAAAILVVVVVSSQLLLATATLEVDRIGARVLVFFVGGGLLLAARSYRHRGARGLLRAAGLVCWVGLIVVLLRAMEPGRLTATAVAAIGLAVLLVVVAVATGRGWRSAWWSRRAEVAEGLCGAFGLASVFVAVGLFRRVWELVKFTA